MLRRTCLLFVFLVVVVLAGVVAVVLVVVLAVFLVLGVCLGRGAISSRGHCFFEWAGQSL